MNELYLEFVRYLSLPGKLSNSAWQDAYFVRQNLEDDRALSGMISVLSRVARARRERLPDVLHNMMVLNSDGAGPEGIKKQTKEKVQSYINMLGRTK